MKIADFFAEIGFKVDTKSLQQFNNSIHEVVGSVRGLAMGLTATMTSWQMLQTAIGRNAQTLLNFKTYTGESVEEVRKLAAVMQGTNLNFSMDVLLNDISTVKKNLRELQIFGEGSSMAQALRVVGLPGLNPGAISTIQDFLKLLKQIPDPATRAMLAERMGLSNQFLNILDLTDEQYRQLESRADKIFPNEDELKRRQKASLEIYLVWLELKNLFESKITDFAPILENILYKIRDIVSDSEKLKMVLEGIKWTFILMTINSIASAVLSIARNASIVLPLLAGFAGVKFAQNFNEQHGIDNMSNEGLRNQAIGGVGGTAVGIGGTAAVWYALKRIVGSGAVKGAASRAAARQAAGGATNLNPWVAGGLALWGVADIAKAIYDVAKQNDNTTPSTGSENFNWNSTLANMTINAQNVYIYASKTNYQDLSIQPADVDYSQQQNNVARTRYSVTGGW